MNIDRIETALQQIAALTPEARVLIRAGEDAPASLIAYARSAPESVAVQAGRAVALRLTEMVGGNPELWAAYIARNGTPTPDAPRPLRREQPYAQPRFRAGAGHDPQTRAAVLRETRAAFLRVHERTRKVWAERGWTGGQMARALTDHGAPIQAASFYTLFSPSALKGLGTISGMRVAQIEQALNRIEAQPLDIPVPQSAPRPRRRLASTAPIEAHTRAATGILQADRDRGETTSQSYLAKRLNVSPTDAVLIIQSIPGTVHIGGGRWRLQR